MKILITTDNTGGVWTYTMNLSRELKKNGIDVHVAVIGNDLTEDQVREVNYIPWHYIDSRQEWMQEPWDSIKRTGEWLLSLKEYIRPDLVHLNSYSYGSLQWRIPVVITAHSCVLSWWEAVKNEQAPGAWSRYKEYVNRGINSADMLIAPSRTMLKAIEKFYRPSVTRTVVYNGEDKSNFTSERKENIVFSMGRTWDEAKNISRVIEAAHHIDYEVYIAGEVIKPGINGFAKNLHFTGKLPPHEIKKWLAKSAIYLLPVLYEPFGYTFLEAVFSGCAIMTGDIDSMREIWGDTAFYVNPRDSIQIASSVNRLMKDPGLRKTLSENALSRAIPEYTSGRMAEEYISIYRYVIQEYAIKNLKLQES